LIVHLLPLIGKWLFSPFQWLVFGIIDSMKTATQSLSNQQVARLQALLIKKDALLKENAIEIKNLQEQNQYLLEQFRLAQHNRFGKSSEVNLDQGELFNEAEQLVDEEALSEQSQDKETTRNKPKRQGKIKL